MDLFEIMPVGDLLKGDYFSYRWVEFDWRRLRREAAGEMVL